MVVARGLAATAIGGALVALLGWVVESESLASLFPGQGMLKVNAALCFVLLGCAVILRPAGLGVRTAPALLGGALALATLAEQASGVSLGIDELFFDDNWTTTSVPGRMSVGTGIALAVLSAGILMLDSPSRRLRNSAHVPVLVAGSVGLVGLVGYASGLDALYWKSDTASMPLQAAVAIVMLAVATLLVAPQTGVIATVVGDSPGAHMLRRLVPVVVLVPATLVIPLGRAEHEGMLGFGVGLMLLLVGTVFVFVPVLLWTARSIDLAEGRARTVGERFAGVLRAATEYSIIGTDKDGTITVFNEGAERLLGYSADDVIGRFTPALIHDAAEVADRAAELGIDPGFDVFVAAARRGKPETREWTYVRKDGRRLPVSLTVTAMHDGLGTLSGYIGIAYDLSGRRELEREVRRQGDFTATLVGSAPIGIFATDEQGGCVFVNPEWARLTGLTPDQAAGDGWTKALHPDDSADVFCAWQAFVDDDEPFRVEYRFARPDGSEVSVLGTAVELRGESGEITGYLGTTLDVTDRHAIERQRERLLAQSTAVLDATTDAILMTDLDGEVRFSNAAMRAFWGEVGLSSVGSIWERISRLARATTSPAPYLASLEAVVTNPEHEHVAEFTLAASDRSFVARTAPVKAVDGQFMGRIFSLRETTTERAASRAKDEFVATVSHELRTPLAAIRGYAELLEDDAAMLEGQSMEFIGVIQRNAERLTRLVDDLLLLQGAEAEPVTVTLVAVQVNEVVSQSMDRVRLAAAGKNVTVALEGEEGIVVAADAVRLGQIVDNLLSNAVKFTPDGGAVTVTSARVGSACTIDVCDSGPGIPDDERGRLFERFFRSRDALARGIPGTGLGLVVARQIAEAHGGTLELLDDDGQSTTFRLWLPLGAVATSATRAA